MKTFIPFPMTPTTKNSITLILKYNRIFTILYCFNDFKIRMSCINHNIFKINRKTDAKRFRFKKHINYSIFYFFYDIVFLKI
jgi:hypothetical protein